MKEVYGRMPLGFTLQEYSVQFSIGACHELHMASFLKTETSNNIRSAKSYSLSGKAACTTAWTYCRAFFSSLSQSWQLFWSLVYGSEQYCWVWNALSLWRVFSLTLWDICVLLAISCSSDWLTFCHFYRVKRSVEYPDCLSPFRLSYDREERLNIALR